MDLNGFLAIVILDGNTITAQLTNLRFERTVGSNKKSTMDGTGSPTYLAGERAGTFTMDGTIADDDSHNLIEAIWAKYASVPFSVEVGDGATVDAGTYAGNVLLTRADQVAEPEDAWRFTMAGDTGEIVFTPPAP